jgi:hypothetical protein
MTKGEESSEPSPSGVEFEHAHNINNAAVKHADRARPGLFAVRTMLCPPSSRYIAPGMGTVLP